MDFHWPRPILARASAECTVSQQQKSILNPQYGMVPRVNSQFPVDMSITLDYLHHRRQVSSCRHRIFLWIQIYLSCMHCFCQTTISALTECLIHSHSSLHRIASDRGIHCTENNVCLTECASILMTFGVLTCSPPSCSSWIHRKVGWPFKDSVTASVKWQNFVGLGKVCQEAVCALNQNQLNAGSEQNQGVKMDWNHSLLSTSTFFYFLSPRPLFFANPKIGIYQETC
jgi:hypothetical protein